jgi:hypothetical protein
MFKRWVQRQTDKIVSKAFLLTALIYGSLFLLGGLVLLIHLWLAWCLAFLIAGVTIIWAGVLFRMRMETVAEKESG